MREVINRYPVAQAFIDEGHKKYKCSMCKDSGHILSEKFSEAARAIYGEGNDAIIVVMEPCPNCEAEKAKHLFEVHPKQPELTYGGLDEH